MNYSEDLINLREERDFGDMLSATFAFVRQEFGPLAKALLYIAGPIILINIVIGSMGQATTAQAAGEFNVPDLNNAPEQFFHGLGLHGAGPGLILLALAGMILQGLAISWVGYVYVRLYDERGQGQISVNDILATIMDDWLILLVASVLSTLFVIVGALLCLAPGLYLMVPMGFFMAGRVLYPGQSLGDAFTDAFELTRERWLATFGVLILIGIVLWAISQVLALPELWYRDAMFADGTQSRDAINGVLLLILKHLPSFLGVLSSIAVMVAFLAAREYHMSESLYDEVDSMDAAEDSQLPGTGPDRDDDEPRFPGTEPERRPDNEAEDEGPDIDPRGRRNDDPDDSTQEDSRWSRPDR